MKTQNILTEKNSEMVEKVLTEVFNQEYALYFKTHSYHWNITGPEFYSLHLMLETQYQLLWESLDKIAERIRVV